MDTQQLNQKYSNLEQELFLEAARGNILTYEEFVARFNKLNDEYLWEAHENECCCDSSIDSLFVKNALRAQEDGESLKDYAYKWCDLLNYLTVDIHLEDVESEEN